MKQGAEQQRVLDGTDIILLGGNKRQPNPQRRTEEDGMLWNRAKIYYFVQKNPLAISPAGFIIYLNHSPLLFRNH